MNDDRLNGLQDPINQAINDAEEISDPLEGLVEKATADPGAPFVPEVLARLAALKREDRAEFEKIRAQLKKAGCRITELDKAIATENGDTPGRAPTQADILIDLVQTAQLFHTPDSTGYADVEVNGHRETWAIRSKGFRRWLVRSYLEATQGAPNSEAMQSALNVFEARAQFNAPERDVHIRVGEFEGKLYLDLTDEAWQAVELDETGWRVVSNPPVRFRRTAGMQALPEPTKGGSIETLRSFLNVQSKAGFVLVVAWLLAALRSRGPYPLLVLSGEQGSAKSTFCLMLRSLLDPNTAPLRPLPSENRDLFIAANNGHVLGFDNVSSLTSWISDTLCRLATGGGFAVRQLYSDQDEVLFNGARPIVLNGIEEIVTRPDLADRAIFLTLDPIPEESRRPEAELWANFKAERPGILGVLLDAVAKGIQQLPSTQLKKLPRMADFALWATACEKDLWNEGTFWSAYCGNLDEAVESVIEVDPIAVALRALMAKHTEWMGTATTLLGDLVKEVSEEERKAKAWPKTPRGLSGGLRRVATFLRKTGIQITFERGKRASRTRGITITNSHTSPEMEANQPSISSIPSINNANPSPVNGFRSNTLRTVDERLDGSDQDSSLTVHNKPLENRGVDGVDDVDADITCPSGPEKMDVPKWSLRL
jgi:hypothetical protein